MAYSGSTLLSLPVITTGTESGKWGDITNNGLTQYLDISIAGALSITASATLANTSGSDTATNIGATTAQYRTLVVPASGPSANVVITAPSSNRTYHVVNRNATYTVQIRAGANSGVTFGVNQSGTVTYNAVSGDYELVGTIGPTVPVARGGTGLTSGTSGGVLYYSATGTLASSGALAASAIVLGGGAGVAPATTTTGTGVVTAIGNSTNAASGLAVLNASGNLNVAQGGTGAGTFTANNVLLGNGTSAFQVVAPGTSGNVLTSNGTTWSSTAPAVSLSAAQTFTALQTFSGSTSVAAVKLANAKEVATISATAATGTINYDITTQSVLYYTSNASANWTVNFRGSSGTSLNTLMSTGESMTVAFLVTQGSTAYYNSAVQVDGSSVTPKYQGGTAWSSGNASSIDAYVYTIVKTGSAAFTVFASQTKFA